MPKYDLEALKKSAVSAADLTLAGRETAEKARDYYDGHQFTAAEIAELQRRKQPIVTDNRIRRKVDAMLGVQIQTRTDPRALPRTPKDEQGADICTKALSFVADNVDFTAKETSAFENLLIEGVGGVEIIAEQVRGKFEIAVNRIRWEEIFYDPHSREKDFSDAAFLGYQKWMPIDRAVELYGEAYQGEGDLRDILEAAFSANATGDTYEDRPFNAATDWADKRQRRVRIAQMYYRSGGRWYLAIFCGGGEIWHDVSPYLDEDGNPACALEFMAAYIDRDNNRHGLVKDMLPLQDEVNKRRSRSLHLLTARQTVAPKGAVGDVAAFKRERDSADGHIELSIEAYEAASMAGAKPFETLSHMDQIAGQFNLLQQAGDAIDNLGPNPALIGQQKQGASGRAIMAQQQAGMAQVAPIYDSLRDWRLRVFRAIWCRVRQFWTEERWIRVTDEANAAQFVPINRVVGQSYVYGMNRELRVVPQVENPVAEIDVDIIIDEAPDYATLREETFEHLVNLRSQGVAIPPEFLIEYAPVRDKARLLEAIKQGQEQQMQMQQQAMQMQQQRDAAELQIDGMTAQAKAKKDIADAEKTRMETATAMRPVVVGF